MKFMNGFTQEPIETLYISTSGAGRVELPIPTGDVPELRVFGPGAVVHDERTLTGHTWHLTGLNEQSRLEAFDNGKSVSVRLPVAHCHAVKAYRSIIKQLMQSNLKLDLDAHMAEVLSCSDVVGEGVVFVPVDADAFEKALIGSGLFHHDDRAYWFGRRAASATIGEGYREVNSPSLHCAVSSDMCSVHLDSYAFMIQGPDGEQMISSDVLQHIPDELWFREPMPWLRRNHHTFAAKMLASLHPYLPNLENLRLGGGLKLNLGGSGDQDYKAGKPRLSLEASVKPPYLDSSDRYLYGADLRLLSDGDTDRGPDWTLTLKANLACRDIACREHDMRVGLFFERTVP